MENLFINIMFLPFIQYHEIGENSTKSLDLSMLLNDTATAEKRKTVNFGFIIANLCKALLIFELLSKVFLFDYCDAIIEYKKKRRAEARR